MADVNKPSRRGSIPGTRDASVIADATRTPPHTPRSVDSRDAALAGGSTRVPNRIRGLLTQMIHPAQERVLEPEVAHPDALNSIGDNRCDQTGGGTGPGARLRRARPHGWAHGRSSGSSPRAKSSTCPDAGPSGHHYDC